MFIKGSLKTSTNWNGNDRNKKKSDCNNQPRKPSRADSAFDEHFFTFFVTCHLNHHRTKGQREKMASWRQILRGSFPLLFQISREVAQGRHAGACTKMKALTPTRWDPQIQWSKVK
jgi:hypothetical protein